ncbi:MAG TPA: S8 family serine peptidase, partial [Thermoanaerobaculia bacterium]|nr:S8 family serine peptidase [Thermoanaerobaculia bacterium]
AAAGNAGNTQLSYPASYNSVVSVAAVDSTGTVASFSQQNSQVELAGPGVWVLSTVPTGAGYNAELVVDGAAYEAGAMQYSATGSATGGLADCGLAGSTCSGVSGKVCLIERGTYSFYDKVKNCQAGGGVAAAIYNNVAGGFSGTLGETNDTTIPAVGISQADGQYLKANKLGASATVTLQTGNYDRYDGTSMATPHVSAVAALVWSHDTSKSNDQVRKALQNTAWDANGGGKDNALGYGIVQAQAALDNLQGGGGGGGCTVTESPETSCSDGVDNDCDGKVDLDDTDCQTGGSCNVTGASCGVNSDCCSGSCKGKPGSKTCK